MTKGLFQHLDEMADVALEGDPEWLERHFTDVAVAMAGSELAERIGSVPVDAYENALRTGLAQSLALGAREQAAAVYFEYDLDNAWQGHFFICREYEPAAVGDNDWASEWLAVVDGPPLPAFAAIFAEGGFAASEAAAGSTLLLVARTVAAFMRALASAGEHFGLAVCLAFHDQDPILRLREQSQLVGPRLAGRLKTSFFEVYLADNYRAGVAYFPNDAPWPSLLPESFAFVHDWPTYELTLRDGGFAPALASDKGVPLLASLELMEFLAARASSDDALQWLPVTVHQTGDRRPYSVLNFPLDLKPLNVEATLWVDWVGGYPRVPVIRRELCGKHELFAWNNHSSFIVSGTLKRDLDAAFPRAFSYSRLSVA